MTLVYPLLLALSLLSIPVVIAFLRRPQPRRVVVASLLLVKALAGAPARSRRIPFRELLALAAMLLALMCTIIGSAFRAAPPPKALLVVLDTSASMAAQDRFNTAKAKLEEVLDDHPDAPVTVITTAPAQTLTWRSEDRGRLRKHVDSLKPQGEDDDLTPLLAKRCDKERPPLLIELTDNAPIEGVKCPVQRPALGDALDNNGITEMSGRAVDGLGLVEVHLKAARPGVVSLTQGTRPLGTVALPDEAAEAVVRLDLQEGGMVRASLTQSDDWADDDRAEIEVPTPTPVETLLITDNLQGFAAAALQAHPSVRLSTTQPPERDEPWDLLVIEAPLPYPTPEARNILILGQSVEALGVTQRRLVITPTLRAVAPQDPLLQYVTLDRLHIARGWTLPDGDGTEVILATSRGPMMTRTPLNAGGQLISVGFQMEDSDLALRPSFANFIANIIEQARPPLPPLSPAAGILSMQQSRPTRKAADQRDAPAEPQRLSFHWLAGLAFVLLTIEWLTQPPWRKT
ncbi:MAG: VWA domain-containing protein [Myxococcota bacterium]